MSEHENIKNKVSDIDAMSASNWSSINPEYVARMRMQNRFKTGLDIAKYTASIMRKDMEEYDVDTSKYTQSLGCWHGFIGQQKLISIKKHFKTTNKKYLYLSGWMIAALRSEFGPLPDQSMHEKTSVASLIAELYTFLRQADARELSDLYRKLDNASDSDKVSIQNQIDNFETHVVPIIADIDAGFCVDEGVIVARTDSLGAGLTKQIAITNEKSDLGDQYNSFLDVEEVDSDNMNHGDVMINQDGKLVRPKRLPSNLYQFKKGTGEARCILDSITSLQNGADLIWIETEKPHIGQIGGMMNEIKKVIPNAKLVYNNSPSFNWTLNFRQQVFDAMESDGKDVSAYDRADLMNVSYDDSELAIEADNKIRTFQADAAREAGIFHHLITLPTYHTAALSTDNLAKEYFGDQGMLGYVAGVQRKEIREGIACVKHQNMSGSDMGDDHKEYFAGEAALKAAGKDNTMNQF